MRQILVSIDIGTSKICTLISEFNGNGELEILGKGISEYDGMKKGFISNIEYTSKIIKKTINQAEEMSNTKVYSAYVGISGVDVEIFDNNFSIEIDNEKKEITKRDIEKLQIITKAVRVPKGTQIIDVIPKCYIVNRKIAVNDPIGMVGSILEMEADIVVGNSTIIGNIAKSVELAGLKVDDLIIEALSHGDSLIYEEERNKGSLIIDVGGSITNLAVFKDDNLIYFTSIPIGGKHISNDISVGCDISFNESEKLKKKLDKNYSTIENTNEEIILMDNKTNEEKNIKLFLIKEIVEARIDEIFCMCKENLIDAGMSENYISSVILTGRGISHIDMGKQICSDIFNVPVRIASGRQINIDSVEFFSAAGISKYIYESIENDYGSNIILDYKPKKNTFSIIRWFMRLITGILK
ncbi:MAG: cell division protein FtsA [Clostridiales bacterium]